MRKLLADLAPLGRLYDPLLGLAARVHRVLGVKHKTLWADDLGEVFMDNVNRLPSMSPRAIVGTYDMHTPVSMIEDDLRLALRERASRWITDWDAQRPRMSRKAPRLKAGTPRGRPVRVRTPIVGMQLRIPVPGPVVLN